MAKRKPSGNAPRNAKQKSRPGGARRKRRAPQLILERIVAAANAEFKRHGFAGATTAAIARRADVTEAQLFRYFRSKSQLFSDTIFKPLNEHFADFTRRYLLQDGNPNFERDMADLYTGELQDFISEHMEMFTSLIVAQLYNPESSQGVSGIDSLQAYFTQTAANMDARVKGRDAKIDSRLMVRIAFAAVLGCLMFRNWIFPAGVGNDDKVRSAINDFVLEGLSANFRGAPDVPARKAAANGPRRRRPR